jgi:uncharacterized protein YndB with AHSA1/START domain
MSLTLPSDREILLTRSFDAPRRLVYDAMTRAEHIRRWWGPRSLTLTVCEVDARPGGAYRLVQRAADGQEFPFKGVYRELVRPERIVFTQIFDVEPYAEAEVVVTIVLTEQGGRTSMRATMLFRSLEERDGMIQSGMEPGAAESYDRLAELLEELA